MAILMTGIVMSCKIQQPNIREAKSNLPETYSGSRDTVSIANKSWRELITDPYLKVLIDTALANNQEVNMLLQEIEIANTEIMERKGEYLPFVNIQAGAGVDKVGRYTRYGALEHGLEIKPGEEFPEPFTDFQIGAVASWELDIWKKLRNAKKSAMLNYLATIEGKNFMVTNLVSEITQSYYELLALDNQLDILNQNIEIQKNALQIVKLQKQAAKVTELAVKRFEAEVAKNQSLVFDLKQRIVETENRIKFLIGTTDMSISRDAQEFMRNSVLDVKSGIPSQLLSNRPDIRQAELSLEAAKIDVKVAKANFYPSLGLSAGLGFQAFQPGLLFTSPESLMFGLAGDVLAPLVNRNAIKARYNAANAKQMQAVLAYEQTVLNAFLEVKNQATRIQNLEGNFEQKTKQVEALTESINIANNLFKSARADYVEVLLTQREALESRMELVETRLSQHLASISLYQSLGGGWR
jgi:outer membrane protein, multidrug efflux system